jgi:hypothetical protein
VGKPSDVAGSLLALKSRLASRQRRRTVTRAVLATTALVLGLLTLGVSSVAADGYAPNCPHGGNLVSSGCYNTNENTPGTYGNWSNEYMVLMGSDSSNGYHINNEMWSYTYTDDHAWVEFGLRQGWDTNTAIYDGCSVVHPSEPGPNDYYQIFWADVKVVSGCATEWRHTVENTSYTGNPNHSYEVEYVGGTTNGFVIYLDYNEVSPGVSTLTGAKTIQDHAVGLEVSGSLSNAYANTYANYPMEYIDSSSHWSDWPSQDTWIDYGCGTAPCLNGTSYATTYKWYDNVQH